MANKKHIGAKKKIDFILSVLILLTGFPLMVIIFILLAVILKSFPVIIQKRGITIDNQVFNIYKFKTIKINPNKIINCESILNKPDLSPYVPSFCRWLRKTGLDELPQIINILKGEMSLVGPRPLTLGDLEVMKKKHAPYYKVRNLINSKPGITGMWQVFGDRNLGLKNLIILDTFYDKHSTLLLDLNILLRTILLVFSGKHYDSIFAEINCNKDDEPLTNTYPLNNLEIPTR